MRKRTIFLTVFLAGTLIVSGCGNKNSNSENTDTAKTSTTQNIDIANMFSDRDMETGYDEEKSVNIKLADNGTTSDSDTVKISDNIVTITEEGTYVLTGALTDGMVIVEVKDTEKVQLVLNGVEITNETSAAIYVRSADKVFITTTENAENVLENGGEYTAIDDNNIDAVIFSKADLTLNGTGSLMINAEAGHGIVSKDDLVLTSGTYEIQSASHGLSGKDSVRVANGTYTITSEKDGIHAENADDDSLGFVYLAEGNFEIVAKGDGISAGNWLQSDGGTYTIIAGDGSENVQKNGQKWEFGPRGEQENTAEENSVSMKGIKAAGDLTVTAGKYDLNTADDSIHSNANTTISGGEWTIASGDDGIHGNSATTISGGTIEITQSYEGIEGLSIDITGGDIQLVSSDDGLNAAGGNDSSGFEGPGGDQFAAEDGAYIHISGGKLKVNASGDGIDSNGELTISGGETYVSGPTNNGNGTLDYSGTAKITGGIFVGAGSSGMAQSFGEDSTQGVIFVAMNSQSSKSAITLLDADKKEIVSWTPDKEYTSVIISAPSVKEGGQYTLTAEETTENITMDSLIYGNAQGMGQAPGNGQNDRKQGTPPDMR
ncbi:carbohydrate-binding domain-containing protein [Faecalimonas hominis]